MDALQAGRSYIKHIPGACTAEMREGDRFQATTNFARLAEINASLICVPTPLGEMREPDLSYLVGTGEGFTPHLKKGQLVVLKNTTYPGTTRDVLCPVLEKSCLVAGKDFLVAFSPEREDPGKVTNR